jgi:hypothetical protein
MFGARHPLGTHAVRSGAIEMQLGCGFSFRLGWVKSRYALLTCVARSSQQELSRNGSDPHRGNLQGTHCHRIQQAGAEILTCNPNTDLH